jgi:hypothetical protein
MPRRKTGIYYNQPQERRKTGIYYNQQCQELFKILSTLTALTEYDHRGKNNCINRVKTRPTCMS